MKRLLRRIFERIAKWLGYYDLIYPKLEIMHSHYNILDLQAMKIVADPSRGVPEEYIYKMLALEFCDNIQRYMEITKDRVVFDYSPTAAGYEDPLGKSIRYRARIRIAVK